MFEKEDYTKVLDRARRKRNNKDYLRYLIIALGAAGVILAAVLAGMAVKKGLSGDEKNREAVQTVDETGYTEDVTLDPEAAAQSEEELKELEGQADEAAEKQAVVDA